MPSHRSVRRLFTAGALTLLSVACSDKSPLEPKSQPDSLAQVPPAQLVVSDPFVASPLAVAARAVSPRPSLVSAGDEVAYVSLPAGTLPSAISVTIRNLTSGAAPTRPSPFLDGGFDPIPVVATAGDELELSVTGTVGSTVVYRAAVPARRPPGVVRTSPPKGATDVAVNYRLTVVFTEPVDAATLTTATVQLLQGTALVAGTVRPVKESLFAVEFVPDKELASGTTYRLVLTRGIRDTEGDSLETEVTTDFTTLTTTVPGAVPVFSLIDIGGNHHCGLEALTGLAYCWGDNHSGAALGVGEAVGFSDTPVPVSGARRFSRLSAGLYATCGIEAQTEFAYCWGFNEFGELGDGTSTIRSVPTLVASGRIRFSDISAGSGLICGVEAQTGVGYCSGRGGFTGDGTLSQRSTPTPIGNGSLRFSSITVGDVFGFDERIHACGIEEQTGLAYCWGMNNFGQLGDGTRTDRLVPTLVGGGRRRFSRIDAGYLLTCGIEAQTGLAYCWGSNEFGEFGDGTTTDHLEPTLVGGGDRRFTSVEAGDLTCGIEAQTSVAYCWGRNNPVPTQIGGGNLRFSMISVAWGDALGLEAQTGRVFRWSYQQLVPTLVWP